MTHVGTGEKGWEMLDRSGQVKPGQIRSVQERIGLDRSVKSHNKSGEKTQKMLLGVTQGTEKALPKKRLPDPTQETSIALPELAQQTKKGANLADSGN